MSNDTTYESSVAELRAELAALRAEVAEIRAAQPESTRGADDTPTAPVDGVDTPVSRRAALRTAGAIAAGALAGGVGVIAAASPAAASSIPSGPLSPTADSSDVALFATASSTRDAIHATATSDGRHGVYATAGGANYAYGVWGVADASSSNVGVRGTSLSGAGLLGDSTLGNGIRATSVNGAGAFFSSTNGAGVSAISDTNYGAFVSSNSSAGLLATSGSSYGITTSSTGGTAALAQGVVGVAAYGTAAGGLGGVAFEAHGDRASIHITPQGLDPTSRNDYYNAGDLHADSTGTLWYCVSGGSSGTAQWRKLASTSTAGAFHPLAPSRVYDSRAASPAQGVIANSASRTVSVADQRNSTGGIVANDIVPSGARAIAANVTVTGTTGINNFCINPGLDSSHGASTINWFASGQTIANGVVLAIANRQVTIVAGAQGGSAHVIIDVTGYWL